MVNWWKKTFDHGRYKFKKTRPPKHMSFMVERYKDSVQYQYLITNYVRERTNEVTSAICLTCLDPQLTLLLIIIKPISSLSMLSL